MQARFRVQKSAATSVYSFLLDYLPQQKGCARVRSAAIATPCGCSCVRLAQTKRGVSELRLEDLTFERVLGFLRELEQTRRNGISTRNQRLAALHTFYEYVGRRVPEMLQVCGQVAAIPLKRSALPETRFMAREEVQTLFAQLPEHGRLGATRSHAAAVPVQHGRPRDRGREP